MCAIHPFMHGSIEVVAPTVVAPTASPQTIDEGGLPPANGPQIYDEGGLLPPTGS
jgi:hypothetical protein